ncbi:hypothetical protein GCM10010423_65100 [Streptomyces levis]|uniref:Uncharacterized protein n=1 Tax=Streptomyces levis TaxID=285566 RepID=A0ABN3P1S4_9ACTN
MPSEFWYVDGFNLSTVAYDIVTRDGLDSTPAVVGENVAYNQQHGERWVRKYFGPARKQLTMWIGSKNISTGLNGADLDEQRRNLDDNIDFLTRLFSRRNKLLSVKRELSDGTTRVAQAEVVMTMDPVLLGLANAKMGVELLIPSGFWRDESSSTLADDIAPGSNIVLSGLAKASAPMTDLIFNVTGPITNPRVTDVESGSWVQYNGAIGSGSTLSIINSTMDITGGTLANMTHAGEVNWLTLYPNAVNGVRVTFSGSGTTGATKLQVVGKKAFIR